MPRGDKTGPEGQGPKTGRGKGSCNVPGNNTGRQGTGQGRGTDQGRGSGQGRGTGQGRGRR